MCEGAQYCWTLSHIQGYFAPEDGTTLLSINWALITQRCGVVSQKNGELKILSSWYEVLLLYCVCVSCFPVHTANLIHHISFFHLIALTVWEDYWLWSLLLFGFFLLVLLLLYLYWNVDCSCFGGLLKLCSLGPLNSDAFAHNPVFFSL